LQNVTQRLDGFWQCTTASDDEQLVILTEKLCSSFNYCTPNMLTIISSKLFVFQS